MRKFAVIFLAVLLAVSVVPFAAGAAEKPIEWVVQGCFPTSPDRNVPPDVGGEG